MLVYQRVCIINVVTFFGVLRKIHKMSVVLCGAMMCSFLTPENLLGCSVGRNQPGFVTKTGEHWCFCWLCAVYNSSTTCLTNVRLVNLRWVETNPN